jgi:hypothetical protein
MANGFAAVTDVVCYQASAGPSDTIGESEVKSTSDVCRASGSL